jgi:hypothetical protein
MTITRKAGILLATVLFVLLALAFTGCSTDDGDDDDSGIEIWTLVEPGATGNFTGVAYGKSTFVAVTDAKEIFWSANGQTWQKEDPGYADMGASTNYVYFFNDRFLLTDRGSSSAGNGNWATSTDGKTWTDIPDAPSVSTAGGAAYGIEKVIVSSNGGNIYISDDFSTWTPKATGVSRVQVTDPNTDPPATATRNINWVNSAAYGKGKYVIGGMGGNIAYSDDLDTWTNFSWETGTDLLGDNTVNQIVFGGDKFIAVGGNPSIGAVSSDGITWAQTGDIQLNTTSDYPHVGYGAGVFIATWQGAASYTTDAYTWTLIADTKFETSTINAIAYGAGKFVMVGGDGKIAYSIPE